MLVDEMQEYVVWCPGVNRALGTVCPVAHKMLALASLDWPVFLTGCQATATPSGLLDKHCI